MKITQIKSLNPYRPEAFGAAPNNPQPGLAIWAGIIGLPGGGSGSDVGSGVRDLLRERLLERLEVLGCLRYETNSI